jgi:hypothetical protein
MNYDVLGAPEERRGLILKSIFQFHHTIVEGLSIAWTPLHPVFFTLFWGHVFFTFQHNLGTQSVVASC